MQSFIKIGGLVYEKLGYKKQNLCNFNLDPQRYLTFSLSLFLLKIEKDTFWQLSKQQPDV